MNFCMEDGSVLKDLVEFRKEKTLVMPYAQTTFPLNEAKISSSGTDETTRKTEVLPAKKSSFQKVVIAIAIVAAAVSGFALYKGINFYRAASVANTNSDEIGKKPVVVTKKERPPVKEGQLKVEIVGKVKGEFGRQFIKCLVTNVGDTVIENPNVELSLYKNDTKIDDVSGRSELKYLKPEQSIPIWISLGSDEEEYTSAQVIENVKQRVPEEEPDFLFPTLIFTNLKMKSEKTVSLLNFKPYPEIYFEVSGMIENRLYEMIETQLFVLFYDDKSEIIGIISTRPADLKKGEKTEFTASVSQNRLFGKPVKFEVIAVNDK